MKLQNRQIEAINFHLGSIAQLDNICKTDKFCHVDPDMISMMLEQSARFADQSLTDLARTGDREGCRLDEDGVHLPHGTRDAYTKWCELGFPALALPQTVGGLQFPRVVQAVIQEICDGANMSFGMLPISLRGAALVLLAHQETEIAKKWLPLLLSGEGAATIAISEPQAGSDVGRINSRVVPHEDGTWRLSGTKIWISYGDHDVCDNILHLVLAKVPGEAVGTAGLGLFAVPKLDEHVKNNGVKISRLEHKMGLHASPTCAMEFDGAVAHLIGKAGEGLQALFPMMNSMRLSVAVQGTAIAGAAAFQAMDYALERPQGGNPTRKPKMIAEHADVRRMLLEMTAQSETMRALTLRTAAYLDLADTSDNEAEKERLTGIAELLLPIAKTICAESGFRVANLAIQTLGGYGYTSDYPLERMARDIRVAAIYEGTSGIQALDLVKRKICADGGKRFEAFIAEINLSLTKANQENPLHGPLTHIAALLENTADCILESPPEEQAACATAFLQLAGVTVLSWCGLDLYEAAGGESAYQRRLRYALELFAGCVELDACKWSHRATGGRALLLHKIDIFDS